MLNLDSADAMPPTRAIPYDINQAAMRFPDFPEKNPEMWFTMLESFFVHANVRSQKNRFFQVLSRLPQHVLSVMDINVGATDMSSAYDELKRDLLQIYGTSDEQRVAKLVNLRQLGTSHPLQLLAEVMSSIPQSHRSCECSRALPPCPFAYGQFRLRLPEKVRKELPLEPASWSVVRLAVREAWDKHCGLAPPVVAAAVSYSDPPSTAQNDAWPAVVPGASAENVSFVSARQTAGNANTPWVCYKHWKFGDGAYSCEEHCNYKAEKSPKGGRQKRGGRSGNGKAGRR